MAVLETTIEIACNGHLLAAGGGLVPIVNVFHYFRGVTAATFNKTNINTIFGTTVVAPWLLACSDRYLLDEIKIRFLDDATDPYQDFTGPGAGAIAGDTLPSYNTVFMYYKPFLRLRIARGNKKFAGIPEAHTTGDVLTGAGLALWQTLETALLAPMVDADFNRWDPTVVSKKAPAQYTVNPTTIVQNVCMDVKLNKRVGRLKRRETISVY